VYLVIEYMEHDLTGLLSQPNADFPESVIKSYMMQLLEGLAYLHGKSVIHRDIKGESPELWTPLTPTLVPPLTHYLSLSLSFW